MSQSKRSPFPADALHVFVLWNLAFAVRLYEVLGRQPAFFTVRRSAPVDIVALALILSILLPGLLVLMEWLAGWLARPVRLGFHVAIVLLSTSAITLPVLKRIDGLSSRGVIVLGSTLGLLATAAYFRFRAARVLLTVLGPAVLLFPGVFLFGSPVFKLVSNRVDPPALDVKIGKPAPVVFLVFDEFCGTSLMNEQREIDPIRYPNFAALAGNATWFRNATTMSPSTHEAIPSLLTGGHPKDPTFAPEAFEFPRNLFTLLGNSHELTVLEADTRLCPDFLSGRSAQRVDFLSRMSSLLVDAAVIELHIVLPSDWPFVLPDVTGQWSNFLGQDRRARRHPHEKRRELFEELLGHIESSEKPGLYFAHVMLPHVPWNYLPSGKEYPLVPFPDQLDHSHFTHGVIGLRRHSENWTSDEVAVCQAHQRYLLQLQFVDRLVGRLVSRLRQAGLYERSTIVITADHGVSFRPNDSRRGITDTNRPDIMSIPLLIKAPHQSEGATSDRNVQSCDVLPTLAGLLRIEMPWNTYGQSALDPSVPERPHKEVSLEEPWENRLSFPAAFDQNDQTLQRMLTTFGSGSKPEGLFRIGPHHELIGRRVADCRVLGAAACRTWLADPHALARVDPDGDRVPCYLSGRIAPRPPSKKPLDLAIAVNGTIRAVTRTFLVPGFQDTWAAMVPEQTFRAGSNEVRVFVVSSSADGPCLHPIPDVDTAG